MQEEPAPEVEDQDLTLVPCNLRCTEATAGRLGANVPPRMSRTNPAPSAGIPLEPSADEMRALLDAVRDRVVAHVASLPAQPAADVEGAAELARDLFEPEPPEAGIPAAEILDLLFDRAIPKSFNTAGPGYLAYIPGGGVFAAAVADLISDATNRYVGVWQAAPALVQLETNVVRWLCGLVGPPGGKRRVPGDGRLARLVHGRRRGAAGEAPRRLPEGDALRLRPDAPRRHEGRLARGVPGGERPGDSVRRAVPGPRRPPRRADRRGPGGRPHAVLRLRERRDDEHGRRRRPRRARGPLRAGATLVARRRGLRRLLPADRAGPGGDGRHREGRLRRPRPAQGALPPVRHRGAPRPRRRGPAPRPRRRRRLPAAHAGGPGLRRLSARSRRSSPGPSAACASGCR